MKFNKMQFVGLLAIGGVSSANAVQLNITGNISAPACTVKGAAAGFDVDMGTLSKDDFVAIGTTVGNKMVRLPLTCSADSTVSIRIDGPKNSDNNALLALQPGAGVAEGLGVGFFDAANKFIALNDDFPDVAFSGGATGDFAFSVAYIATKVPENIIAGSANATAQINIVTR